MTKNLNKARCRFHLEFKNQPNFELRYYRGPTLIYLEDALEAAEKALDDGAQHVVVYAYPSATGLHWTEKWTCGRNKKWRTSFPSVPTPKI